MFTRANELPEGVTRLPIKTIHINKSPVVVGNLKTLSPEMAARWGIDVAQALQHVPKPRRQQVHGARRAVARGVRAAEAPAQAVGRGRGPVRRLRRPHADRGRLQRLRELAPEQLAAKRLAFDDARLEEIVFRYRARNFADTLSEEERERWEQHRVARLHEGEGGALTVEAFFERIDALNEAADDNGQEILAALYDWAEQIAPER